MFKLDDCIGFITNKASKKLSDEFNSRLLSVGMTRVQWIALYYIGKNDKITQKELSDKMDVKESTMVRLVDRMENEKLVKRIKDNNDRRVSILTLTSEGKKLREDCLPIGEKFSTDATLGINQEDLNIFTEVLKRMIINVNIDIDNTAK